MEVYSMQKKKMMHAITFCAKSWLSSEWLILKAHCLCGVTEKRIWKLKYFAILFLGFGSFAPQTGMFHGLL